MKIFTQTRTLIAYVGPISSTQISDNDGHYYYYYYYYCYLKVNKSYMFNIFSS